MCKTVQDLVDLLAVCQANVRLAHQAPDFFPDVILIHLHNTFYIVITVNVLTKCLSASQDG